MTGNKYDTEKKVLLDDCISRYHARNGRLQAEHLYERQRGLDGSTRPPTLGQLSCTTVGPSSSTCQVSGSKREFVTHCCCQLKDLCVKVKLVHGSDYLLAGVR